jgi:hypothetical protein
MFPVEQIILYELHGLVILLRLTFVLLFTENLGS